MKLEEYVGAGLLAIGGLLLFLGSMIYINSAYFFMIGGILMGIGFYVFQFRKKEGEVQNEEEFEEWKNALKIFGTPIDVRFDECEIKSSEYRDELIVNQYLIADKYIAMNGFGEGFNIKKKDLDQRVIVFETKLKGEKRIFCSALINASQSALQRILSTKETTKIYKDDILKNNYYFDLEFISEEK